MRDCKRLAQTEEEYSRYEKMEKTLYKDKQSLLSYYTPIVIHKLRRVVSQKAFDWEDNFLLFIADGAEVHQFIDRNGFPHRYAIIDDVYYEYFLVYEVSGYTTHVPISEESVDLYNLPIVTIPTILNDNKINAMYSVSQGFCNKVISGIEDGSLHFIDSLQAA